MFSPPDESLQRSGADKARARGHRQASAGRALPGIVAAALLLVPDPGIPAEADEWAPIRFMLGSWTGIANGEPGAGTVRRDYSFVLGDKFIHERNQTTYLPQERNKKGEVHEHWSLIGYDTLRKVLTLRQFHQEGFVVAYVLNAAASSSTKIVFESEQLENIDTSWRARETYEVISASEFTETFELSQPGARFEIYSQTRFKKTRP